MRTSPTVVDRGLSLLRRPLPRSTSRPPLVAGAVVPELAERLGRPLRVAVVRNDGIGDWILTLPVLTALDASEHVGTVTIVAPAGYRRLLAPSDRFAYLDFTEGTIIAPPAPGGTLGKVRAVAFPTGSSALASGALHRDEFDLVVLPRWDSDLGFNARAWAVGTDSPIVGQDPAAVPGTTGRERRESGLLDLAVHDPDAARHEVEHHQALLAALGLPTAVAQAFGSAFLGIEPAPAGVRDTVVVHASSNEPKRQWPIERWTELIGLMLERFDGQVLVIGSPADAESIHQIVSGFPERVEGAPGSIPLGDLPRTLAERARLFVGNDSGPAHIAASVGVPVVVVSPHPLDGDATHRNSPSRFRPWGEAVRVVQPAHALGPCTDACTATSAHCIAQVTVADVTTAVDSLT